MTSVLIRERSGMRKRDRKCRVEREAEMGMWSIYRPREARIARQYQKFGQTWDRCFLRASRKNEPCQHLDFRLLAPRTVREYVSVVFSYPVGGNLLWQLWETNRV